MTISEFKGILLNCCDAVYHFEGHQEKSDYIIWHEIGKRHLHADNGSAESAVRIAVDFFTKREYPEEPEKLECAFSCNGISFRGPDILFRSETNMKQYSYTVEVT